MWVLRKLTASKLSPRRRVSLLAIAAILVLFAIAGPLVKQASAAGDTGTWSGSTLEYNGDKYTQTTKAPKYQDTTTAFQSINTSVNPNIALVIYFKGDLKAAQAATSATMIHYIYTSPDKYSDPSPPADVTITPAGQDPSKNTSTAGSAAESSSTQSSCNAQYFGGVGWIVCSVSTWIANGVDGIYDLIKQFLEVDTISQSNNGVFQIWQMVLGVANIAFIIIFLIIVYSQLTSIGISNYSIKDMIPRLIIAAILVNFSFWICQLFVDISNVLGYSIEALFMHVKDSLNIKVDIPWADLTTVILSGGTIATSTLAFAAVAGGSFASLGFILLGALISAGLAVLVAFVILAARQALIVVLVMLAPLAFVAMVLPSTKELFEKWRKAFQTLLLFFPIFAVLFGGSQLAGAAIIKSQEGQPNNVNHIAVILIGLAVQVIPLFITPLILQFSSGILGRIAGMANDRKRGLVDRAKHWTQSNADDFKMRKLANAADRRAQQRPNETRLARALRQGRPSNLGLALDQSKRTRERRTKRNGEYLEHRSEANEIERINNPNTAAFGTRTFNNNQRQRMIDSHSYHESASLHKGQIDSEGAEHWARQVDQSPYLRNIQRQTALNTGTANTITDDLKARDELAVSAMIHTNQGLRSRAVNTGIAKNLTSDYKASIDAASAEGHLQIQRNNQQMRQMREQTDLSKKRAADIDASMTAVDQRTYDTLVNEAASPQYQRIREMKVQTIENQKQAQFQAGQVEAAGEREYNRAFEDGVTTTFTDASGNTRQIRSRDLRQQNIATDQLKKENASIQNTLQKRADAHWAQVSRNDEGVQGIRVAEDSAIQSAKLTEERWNEFIEDVHENGAAAAGVFANNASYAAAIQRDHEAAEQVERRVKDMQATSHSNADAEYLETERGRESRSQAIKAQQAASQTQTSVESTAKREYTDSDEGKRRNQDAQAAQSELSASEAAEAARIEEMKTKKKIENLTDPDEIAAAQRLHDAGIVKRAQDQRAANAQGVAVGEYADEVQESTPIPGGTQTIAQVAGGIDDYGERRAISGAYQVAVDQFNKNTDTEKKTMTGFADDSDDPNQETWMSIVKDRTQSDERRAAAAGKIMQGGAMKTIQKLYDYTMGANPDELSEKSRKNIQQQMGGDIGRVPFGMGSGQRAAMTRGGLTPEIALLGIPDNKKAAIIEKIENPSNPSKPISYYDAMLGTRTREKLAPEALVGLDPDDRIRITRLVQDHDGDGGLVLGAEAQQNLIDAIHAAATNEKTKGIPQADAKKDYNRILHALGQPELTTEDWA